MPADAGEGQLEGLCQRRGRGVARRQCPRDPEPLRIRQRAKDIVRVLGHVGLVPYHDAMLLTDPQRRTLDRLIGTEERPVFAADLRQRLVDRIEGAARELELGEPLWLGKEALNQLARCEGRFAARLEREDPPFEHSLNTAAGVLVHKAIEVDVGARDGMDPHAIATTAAERLTEREERFAEFWRERSGSEQDDLLMEVVRKVTLFQGSFPPLRELRREMAPITELPVKAQLLGGELTLSGKIDLVLGVPDRLEPNRATRLAVDLKTGGAWPEHAEDMRFYALLMTLRFGVPPYRVASLFLDSGEWQAEEVDRGDALPRGRPCGVRRESRRGPPGWARASAHAGVLVRVVSACVRLSQRRAAARLVQGGVQRHRREDPEAGAQASHRRRPQTLGVVA